MIELKNLFCGYGKAPVVRDLSLRFRRGEISALIGPNGCGKTTLLKTACGLLPRLSGEILINGRSVSELSRKELARSIALLPQSRTVPDIDVLRFVSHGRFPHLGFPRTLTSLDREIVENALCETGCQPYREKRLAELSGGERQRVYLAMALAQDSDAVFLDEPTAYLDVDQKYEVMELIKKINSAGKTVVMVLHDLPLAFSYGARLFLMQKGSLAISGTPEEVFASEKLKSVLNVEPRLVATEHGPEYLFTRHEV